MILTENQIVRNALRNLEANTGIAGYWTSQDNYDDGIDGGTKITMGKPLLLLTPR
jgi:hypothetical protein